MRVVNESAVSFAWLARSLGLPPFARGGAVQDAWESARDEMRVPVDQSIVSAADWDSDPWLVKGAKSTVFGTVASTWEPPDAIDEWPGFGVGRVVEAIGLGGRRTHQEALSGLLKAGRRGEPSDAAAAVERFVEMESEIERHGDARMVQGEHLRAWLLTSVGPLLRGLVLETGVEDEVLVEWTTARLALPFRRELSAFWDARNRYEERRLDVLYNLMMTPTGPAPLDEADVRVGEGEPWRESWSWLRCDIPFEDMHEALQVTARVMRSFPVVAGLVRALRSGHRGLETVALAVVRRWLLTLKAMSWLEASALASWRYVRPQDLACFAFSAVRPVWPRRILAVSHRSADVKPVMRTMRLWRSSRCAIDACYVPSWETNNGMVWALFGPTPAIARVTSPGYDESVWCLREAELAQHLIERLDFVKERFIIDVEHSRVRSLDRAYAVWDVGDASEPQAAAPTPEFPPLCHVWTPPPMPVWEVKMLRASAALRAINVMLGGDPELANTVASFLLGGMHEHPVPPPTNNPTGWNEYVSIFRRLQEELGDDASDLAIRLPADYGSNVRYDDELLERVPDLSRGAPALGDVLVALEYLRTEWPILVDQGHGRFLAVVFIGLSRETFTIAEQLSLQRGLLHIRLPVPIWIIQSGEQDVENWGLPGDPPIFTEHVANQFSWMMEGYVPRAEMQSRYPEHSGLELSPALQRLCRDGG